jgi:hypothetical protein
MDTGSDLCVFPHKLVPYCRTCVNYNLCAANCTTISIYRRLPLSLNLGLHRDFTWRFVVADITQPHRSTHFSTSWMTPCENSTSASLTWMTSSFSPGLLKSLSNIYGLFDQLQRYRILANPAKFVSKASEVTLLSYRISAEGSQSPEERVAIFRTALLQDHQPAPSLLMNAQLL